MGNALYIFFVILSESVRPVATVHDGEQLNKLYKEILNEDAILRELEPIIAAYAHERERGEHFGDFVIRKGYVKETAHGTNFHQI